MSKKIFLGINVFAFVLLSVGNYFYLTVGGLLIKSLCSACFALLGFINLIYAVIGDKEDISFHRLMSLGLILAMLGDIFLGFNFILGAALFALGHICFFVSYCFIIELTRRDLIICGVLFAATGIFVLFCPLLTFSAVYMKYVCFVYAGIISLMVGKAISNFITERNAVTLVLLVGSILFFFSDLMLVFDWFADAGAWSGKLCMATYYPAEWLLAFSIFLNSISAKITAKKGK